MVWPFILLQSVVFASGLATEASETTAHDGTEAILENIALAELARADPSSFQGWSQNISSDVRERTSLALGRLSNPESLSLLGNLLKDQSVDVREEAAFAMAITPDAREHILNALSEETTPRVRGVLISALGRHVEPEDVPTVLEGLYGERDEQIGGITALGLAGRSKTEGVDSTVVTTPLADLIDGIDLEVSRLSAWSLSQIRPTSFSPETETDLWRLARDHHDPIVRSRTIRALSASFTDLTGVPLVEVAAADHSPMVRVAAARALALAPAERAVTALERLIDDRDPSVRSAAVVALSTLPQAVAEPILLVLTSSQDLSVAVEATRAISAWGSVLHDEEVETRPEVIAARITSLSPEEQLNTAINDPRPIFRTSAAMALMDGLQIDESDEPQGLGTELGWSLLGSSDPKIQSMAIDLLEGAVSLPGLSPILEAMLNSQDIDLWRSGTTIIEKAVELANRRDIRNSVLDNEIAASLYGSAPPELMVRVGAIMSELGLSPPPPIAAQALSLPNEIASIVGAVIVTDVGDIHVELLPDIAPMAVATFTRLSEEGFYDGIRFHRVVPDFVVQAGCPRGDGWGDPGFSVPDEVSDVHYVTGSMGVANAGPDTGGSQWFITLSDQPHLDGRYTLFGEVSLNNTVLRRVELGTEIETIRIERLELSTE